MLILHPSSRRPRRRAFTLVELLTVIIIIGLLMALLVPAVMSTRIKALDARMVAELAQLDASMKQYKDKYGGYPPANWTVANGTQVVAHLRRAFPRVSSPSVINLNAAEVLVFALGGDSDNSGTWNSQTGSWTGSGSTKVQGFNMNPANPMQAGGQRTTPFFQFDQGRLIDEDGNGWYEYYPPHKRTVGDGVPPYVYFDFTSYPKPGADTKWGIANNNDDTVAPTDDILEAIWSGSDDVDVSFTMAGVGGVARAYASSTSGGWMNPDSFQIICAGQDNDFGNNRARAFPSGGNYNPADYDNLTNFSTTRLEDSIP